MGHDFSGVNVHTDSRAADSARSVGDAAYTFGGHVVFGEGKFQPGSVDCRRLLTHELAHVIQQDESGVAGTPKSLGQPRDAAEEWADRQSRSALEGATCRYSRKTWVGQKLWLGRRNISRAYPPARSPQSYSERSLWRRQRVKIFRNLNSNNGPSDS